MLEPMPAPRPRARVIRSKSGKSFVSIYNPAEYTNWKADAVEQLSANKPPTPYDWPMHLTVTFHVKRPKTTKLHAPKPDIDNYCKSILDALTQAEWWTDDTLVTGLAAEKVWANPGEDGCIAFSIDRASARGFHNVVQTGAL
jgi:Holliday junction resolvase RusA-like endonuclease